MPMEWILIALIGTLAGVLSGLLGVGGGLVIVPLLLFVAKLDIHQAVATSLVIIVPTAAVGALRHYWAGNIVWRHVFIITLFAMAGGFLGAQIATSLSSQVLKNIFAIFLVAVAVRMLTSR